MNANVRMPMDARAVTDIDDAELEVVVCRTLPDIMQAMAVRSLVYMGEQACPYDEEYDGNDFAGTTHLVLRRNGEPIGTLRVRWFAEFAKVERVAVRSEFRGGRATLMLILAAKRLAEKKNYRQILGYGQVRLIPFWEQYFNARIRPGREGFAFSDHDYVEMVVEGAPPPDALTLESDPMVLLRPEGAWDEAGILDRSAARPATRPSLRRSGRGRRHRGLSTGAGPSQSARLAGAARPPSRRRPRGRPADRRPRAAALRAGLCSPWSVGLLAPGLRAPRPGPRRSAGVDRLFDVRRGPGHRLRRRRPASVGRGVE